MKILVHAANITKFQNLLKAYKLSHLNHNTFIYVWRPEHLHGYRGNYLVAYSDYFIHQNSHKIMDVAASRDLQIVEGPDAVMKFMTGVAYLQEHPHAYCNDDKIFCHFLQLEHDINEKEQMHTNHAHCTLFHEGLQYDLVSGYRCDECISKFG